MFACRKGTGINGGGAAWDGDGLSSGGIFVKPVAQRGCRQRPTSLDEHLRCRDACYAPIVNDLIVHDMDAVRQGRGIDGGSTAWNRGGGCGGAGIVIKPVAQL